MWLTTKRAVGEDYRSRGGSQENPDKCRNPWRKTQYVLEWEIIANRIATTISESAALSQRHHAKNSDAGTSLSLYSNQTPSAVLLSHRISVCGIYACQIGNSCRFICSHCQCFPDPERNSAGFERRTWCDDLRQNLPKIDKINLQFGRNCFFPVWTHRGAIRERSEQGNRTVTIALTTINFG